MCIELIRPGGSANGWGSLEAEWRALEAEADGSFFQSWTWVGCRVAERFTDPLLLRASAAGRVVGLALFNCTGPPLARRLWLHETGSPAQDSVFIEYNGPLLARGHTHLLRPMLAAALRHGRVTLSGVSDEVLRAARDVGACHRVNTRPASRVRLRGMASDADWLASLSASTRYQLRRSRRSYEALGGPGSRLMACSARDVAEAWVFLDQMAALHQATWVARGKPGAFAEPAFLAFHRELLARGLPRGEAEMLKIRIAVGTEYVLLGNLYNFRWRDHIYSYQTGFNYVTCDPHRRPGLSSHHLAIGKSIQDGVGIYDFMAGQARYKASLSNDSVDMHWLELVRPWSLYDIVLRLRAILGPQARGKKSVRDEPGATAGY
jgi:CelD/BcsL family acetyltransferase involved in cellulose biosynthesis